METIHQWFMHLGLRKKLVLLIYSCVFTVFCLVSAVLLVLSGRYMHREVRNAYSVTTQQITAAFDSMCSESVSMSDFFSVAPLVQSMFREANNGKTVRMPDEAMRLMLTYPDTLGVVFYDKYGRVIDYVTTDGSYGPLWQGKSSPLSRMVQENIIYEWEFIHASDETFMTKDNTSKLCLWRIMKDPNDYSVIGAAAITTDISRLGSFRDKGGNEGVWIHRGEDTILKQIPEGYPAGWEKAVSEAENGSAGSAEVMAKGVCLEVVYEKSGHGDFYIDVMYPYTGFGQGTPNLFLYGFFALAVFLIMLIPILFFIFTILIRPIRKLTQSMLQFADGDFHTQVALESQDEIGMMGKVFNYMVAENRRQIETIYLMKLREREAELDNLQAQINPHFLYNVLDTIHWSALRNGSEEIAEMAYSLGQVFRLSLHRGERKIPLEDEKKLVEYYLKLQKVRYKDRIEYELEFEPDTLKLSVLKLLLQPLVENAVIHGIGNSVRSVHLRVSASIDGEWLILCVKDDGRGIPKDKLERILDEPTVSEQKYASGSHYALRNINQRLHLEYGDSCKFIIESAEHLGTTVTIRFLIQI
ncbi:MAG: histidine kinase [Eubacteriales bacterium]|nr:histidine kinase [Eubacteriales bacterium]